MSAPREAGDAVTDADVPAPWRRLDGRVGLGAFVAITTTGLVVLLWLPAARLDFYFDEIWRIEIVRSSSPVSAYLAGPAPIPPGWAFTLWSVFEVLPDRRPLLRLASALPAIPAALLLASSVRRVMERRMGPTAACAIAALAAPLTLAAPGLAIHATYFNNYLTDVAIAVAIVWTLIAIQDSGNDSMTPWWSLVVLSLIAPWFGQGALFLLPGAAVIVARHVGGHHRIAWAAAVGTVVSSAVVGLVFLRPVASGATLVDYWRAETPSVGFWSFARRFATTFVDSAFPQSLSGRPVALVVLAGFAAYGAFRVHSACRWWLPLFASAAGVAICTSAVTGWPATFVRNNSSFQVLLVALMPIGIGCVVVRATSLVRQASRSRTAAVAWSVVAVLALTAVWLPRSIRANSTSEAVFARGLTDDVATVAARLRPQDVVLAYHLSGPYVRDVVLNTSTEVDGVEVVDEARVGELTSVSPWARDETGTVWCVVPFEAGPDATDRACPPSTDWVVASIEAGRRATLIQLVRAP